MMMMIRLDARGRRAQVFLRLWRLIISIELLHLPGGIVIACLYCWFKLHCQLFRAQSLCQTSPAKYTGSLQGDT